MMHNSLRRLSVIVVVIMCLFALACHQKTQAPKQVDATAPKTNPQPKLENIHAWMVTESTNKMDDSNEVTLVKLAEDGSLTMLAVRCVGGKTDVIVNTDSILTENPGVRIKFDESTPRRQWWSRSANYTALFAPNAIDFAREMAKHERFLVEFQPHDERPRTVEFKVTGLDEKLDAVAQACNWAEFDKAQADSKAAAAKARVAATQLAAKKEAYDRQIREVLSAYIEPCREKWVPAGRWCWHDEDNTNELWTNSVPQTTKEEALEDAVRWAMQGKAFQSVMAHLK